MHAGWSLFEWLFFCQHAQKCPQWAIQLKLLLIIIIIIYIIEQPFWLCFCICRNMHIWKANLRIFSWPLFLQQQLLWWQDVSWPCHIVSSLVGWGGELPPSYFCFITFYHHPWNYQKHYPHKHLVQTNPPLLQSECVNPPACPLRELFDLPPTDTSPFVLRNLGYVPLPWSPSSPSGCLTWYPAILSPTLFLSIQNHHQSSNWIIRPKLQLSSSQACRRLWSIAASLLLAEILP